MNQKRRVSALVLTILFASMITLAFEIQPVRSEPNFPLMGTWWHRADINSDGAVNILDVTQVALAFGSSPGHERWNCRADITRDQQVNILDLAAIALDFGKSFG